MNICKLLKQLIAFLHKCPPTVCDECNKLHRGECPVHGPLPELDHTAGYDQASLAFTELPVPAQLTVKTSRIPGAGLGVFATSFIPKGVKLGQYEGKRVAGKDVKSLSTTAYAWEVGMISRMGLYMLCGC